jgi:hypothetical protein
VSLRGSHLTKDKGGKFIRSDGGKQIVKWGNIFLELFKLVELVE